MDCAISRIGNLSLSALRMTGDFRLGKKELRAASDACRFITFGWTILGKDTYTISRSSSVVCVPVLTSPL